jgi:hypothetical protein
MKYLIILGAILCLFSCKKKDDPRLSFAGTKWQGIDSTDWKVSLTADSAQFENMFDSWVGPNVTLAYFAGESDTFSFRGRITFGGPMKIHGDTLHLWCPAFYPPNIRFRKL